MSTLFARSASLADPPAVRVTRRAGGVLQRCGDHPCPPTGCTSEQDQEEETLQRHASGPAPDEVPAVVRSVVRSPGTALEPTVRTPFEDRIGRDFSGVRVHTDARAAASTQAVQARAYTVGRHIVFGSGAYNPASRVGRRLLAHELVHVAQQGGGSGASREPTAISRPHDAGEREADAIADRALDAHGGTGHHTPVPTAPITAPATGRGAIVQRTPAPPTYQGVTGVRDPNRIRIDAVPDFLASSMTAPRAVNVHFNEPAVVHMTWMLYDPNDRSMSGSYSTLPSASDATTRPFELQASHFSGAGFVPGEYLLRCVGLNAQHRPVVYTDRVFNVYRSDLTTGTALPTTHGDLTFTRYSKTDATTANPNWSIDVELRFLPKTSVDCDQLGFIQALDSVDFQGRSLHRFVSPEQDARQTPLAWSIDRVAGAPTSFYVGTRDSRGQVVAHPGWGEFGSGGDTPTRSSLIDRPSWNQESNDRFESCVVCRTGQNRGKVYGCATWGYRATAAGKVTLMPRGFRQMPSDQFKEANDGWNAWRTSVPAASRPEETPALSSP